MPRTGRPKKLPPIPAVAEAATASQGEGARTTANLLAEHRTMLAQLKGILATMTKSAASSRDISQVSSAITRTLSEIGKLTGEGSISEAQVIQSQAFQRVMFRVKSVLIGHPDIAAEIAAALQPRDAGPE